MSRNESGNPHPEAKRAADWMRGRLVGALRSQGGSQAAFAVLKHASQAYGPAATDEALRLIRADALRPPVR
jgi:hypothetical protein